LKEFATKLITQPSPICISSLSAEETTTILQQSVVMLHIAFLPWRRTNRVHLVVVESYRSFHLNLKVYSLNLKEKESFGDLTQCTAAIGYWNSEPRSKRLEAQGQRSLVSVQWVV
jgi:hypothetical protein